MYMHVVFMYSDSMTSETTRVSGQEGKPDTTLIAVEQDQ